MGNNVGNTWFVSDCPCLVIKSSCVVPQNPLSKLIKHITWKWKTILVIAWESDSLPGNNINSDVGLLG